MADTEQNVERFMPESMDDLRGRTPEELRKMLEVLDAHLKSLHQSDEGELRDLTDEEESAFNVGMDLRTEIVERLDKHTKIAEVFRRRPAVVQQAMANIRYGLDDPAGDTRRLTNPEARDKALRVLDSRDAGDLSDAQKTQVDKLLRRDTVMARRILVTENEDYRSAWMKMVTDVHPVLTPEENRAVQAWYEFRALGDWTTTAGGFGIPVFIDPSIILTAQESGNPFLSIAKQVTVNTNQWKGVSSAGVTWAFQTEAAAATDNSPTLAQPTVLVHMARGFIPYSIEVGMDYPGFASEMGTLLAQGYDELLVNKFTIGSGTGEPKGILTAISATSGDRVKVTTGGSIGAPDPYAVWKSLPQKYRRNASWLMSVGVNNAIRQIGAANVFHGYTVNLPEGWADQLFNRPVYESAYMPDTTTWTTTAEGQAIVGDFSNFVIARNGGMSVELVPQLFQQVTAGTGPAVPTGQRGWFAYARIGSDSSNTAGFRLLVANS
ncbi:MAG TPA: phage major capsid protein [Streptosporangiaceae bacterium]|jgi:HK97 family phage major capsid protein